jgi:hypothetical protein
MTTTARRRVYAAAAALSLSAGLAVAAPPSAGAAGLPATALATNGSRCSTGSLPPVVTGRPTSLHPGVPLGYWVWHDTAGWHVAATHPPKSRVVLVGVVRSSSPMRASGVRLERGRHGDRWVLSRNRRALTFRFTNGGGLDALRIGASCSATMTFTLYADGHEVAPSLIHLGSGAVAATSNPVVVRRLPSP